MKITKKSEIRLGSIFTESLSFKIWRVINKIKKITNPNVYRQSKVLNTQYGVYTPEWIKHVIIPSRAYQRWKKLYKYEQTLKNETIGLGKKYLPYALKKFVKKNIPGLFPIKADPVPKQIASQWNKWLEVRSDRSIDLINFSVINYDYRIQRPQNLAREMSNLGHRVFYIENDFVFAPHINGARFDVTEKHPNLYTINLASSKNYFIYSDSPSEKDRKIIIASIKKLLYEARILNPVAKIDHPFWESIADELGMPIIYDAMDLHSGFKENTGNILEYERKLVEKSDIILSTSDYISHEFRRQKAKILSLKNAGEYTHFEKSTSHQNKPPDIRGLPGPIIGYYGALADWFDCGIIEGLAKDFPNSSIVLIGLVNSAELERLADRFPNIHLLGEKPYSKLPKYLAAFDVCLIPFKLNKLIQATNPVKIYEYFASGKPVISTRIPELSAYRKLVYFAKTKDEFSKSVKKALREKSSVLAKERQSVAKTNTWQMRAKTLEKYLFDNLYPKVSIIILIYNHAEMSRVSLETTLNRTKYPNFEVLAVDNKSDDKTIKMLKSFGNIKNVRIIFNPENYGFAKGNNIGMKLATGKYLILLNNDVRVTPGWVERLVYQGKKQGIGLVGPVTNSIGNESKINIVYDPENQAEIEAEAAVYTYSHWGKVLKLRDIAAFAWLKPRWVYEKLGELDDRFGRGLFEDDDYCVRVKKAKLEIICTEDAFVHHYGGASTNWGSPEFQLLFNTNKEKFEKKWHKKWTPHEYRKR